MSCDKVQERGSSFLDRKTTATERENVLAHIGSCRNSSDYLESQMTVQMALRSLDRPSVPAQLTTRLRVTASHELARRQAHRTVATWLHSIYSRVQLTFDNLMRPLAFPFAGGIVSALMIFGLLVPSLTFQHTFADQALFTYPDGEVVVIDPNGDFTSAPDSINAPRIQRVDAISPA